MIFIILIRKVTTISVGNQLYGLVGRVPRFTRTRATFNTKVVAVLALVYALIEDVLHQCPAEYSSPGFAYRVCDLVSRSYITEGVLGITVLFPETPGMTSQQHLAMIVPIDIRP